MNLHGYVAVCFIHSSMRKEMHKLCANKNRWPEKWFRENTHTLWMYQSLNCSKVVWLHHKESQADVDLIFLATNKIKILYRSEKIVIACAMVAGNEHGHNMGTWVAVRFYFVRNDASIAARICSFVFCCNVCTIARSHLYKPLLHFPFNGATCFEWETYKFKFKIKTKQQQKLSHTPIESKV